MKKTLLLLPLGAVALGACSTNRAAPVEYASNVNPATKKMNTRQHTVRRTKIPSSMKVASQHQKAVVVSKPKAVVKPTKKIVKKITQKVRVKEKEVEKKFNIPRDDTTHKPIYSQIDKGSYDGNIYTVRKGDTIFLIAYIAGMDVPEVAKLNGLKEPYSLSVGQKIKLSDGYKEKIVTKEVVVKQPVKQQTVKQQPVKSKAPKKPEVTYTPAANGTAYGSDGTITGPIKATAGVENSNVIVSSQSHTQIVKAPSKVMSSLRWRWPAKGRISAYFSSSDGGNKGIDIRGSKGSAIKAASSGKVVYAGDALQGYGNLIIIKHNDNYLSAYAHNDEILIDEGDQVKIGQRIATMGSTGTDSTKLHFEIRYKGKSVNPMSYLPRR